MKWEILVIWGQIFLALVNKEGLLKGVESDFSTDMFVQVAKSSRKIRY